MNTNIRGLFARQYRVAMTLVMLISVIIPAVNVTMVHAEVVVNGRIAYNTANGVTLANPDGTQPVIITDDELGEAVFSSFSKDGTKFAYMVATGFETFDLKFGVVNSAVRQTVSSGALPVVSPDGSKVLYQKIDDDIKSWHVVDMDGQNDVNLGIDVITDNASATIGAIDVATSNSFSPIWSPDSNDLYYSRVDVVDEALNEEVHIYRIASDGGSLPEQITQENGFFFMTISSDGQTLYYIRANAVDEENVWEIVSLDLTDSEASPFIVATLSDLVSLPSQLQLSPDDSKLAFVTINPFSAPSIVDAAIYIYDLNDDATMYTIFDDGLANISLTVAWSPDSTKLAYSIATETEPDVYTHSAWKVDYNGENLVKIIDNPSGIEGAVYLLTPTSWLPQTMTLLDGNGDGVLDALQQFVMTFISAVTGKYVTLETSSECSITSASISTEGLGSSKDSGFDYPNGLMDFEIDCGTPGFMATINHYYFDTTVGDVSLRKFVPAANSYLSLEDVSGIQAGSFSGRQTIIVTYQITDGGTFDDDGIENGIIVDPAGLGVQVVGIPNTGISR